MNDVTIAAWVAWSSHDALKLGIIETGRSYVTVTAETEITALLLAAQIAGCKDGAVVTGVFLEL